jgi:hypothetical protein
MQFVLTYLLSESNKIVRVYIARLFLCHPISTLNSQSKMSNLEYKLICLRRGYPNFKPIRTQKQLGEWIRWYFMSHRSTLPWLHVCKRPIFNCPYSMFPNFYIPFYLPLTMMATSRKQFCCPMWKIRFLGTPQKSAFYIIFSRAFPNFW